MFILYLSDNKHRNKYTIFSFSVLICTWQRYFCKHPALQERGFQATQAFLPNTYKHIAEGARKTPGSDQIPCRSVSTCANTSVTGLVADACGDPNRATQCRALSVTSNSRRIRDVVPKSRYTLPNQGVAPSSGPPYRTFLSFAAGRGPRGGVAAGW